VVEPTGRGLASPTPTRISADGHPSQWDSSAEVAGPELDPYLSFASTSDSQKLSILLQRAGSQARSSVKSTAKSLRSCPEH